MFPAGRDLGLKFINQNRPGERREGDELPTRRHHGGLTKGGVNRQESRYFIHSVRKGDTMEIIKSFTAFTANSRRSSPMNETSDTQLIAIQSSIRRIHLIQTTHSFDGMDLMRCMCMRNVMYMLANILFYLLSSYSTVVLFFILLYIYFILLDFTIILLLVVLLF